MSAVLIKTDGSQFAIFPKNGTDFSFLELQELLGVSLFEIVELPDNRYLIVDESGALKDGRIKNEIATNYYNSIRISKEEYEAQKQELRNEGIEVIELNSYDDFAIYGDIILCDKSMVK